MEQWQEQLESLDEVPIRYATAVGSQWPKPVSLASNLKAFEAPQPAKFMVLRTSG